MTADIKGKNVLIIGPPASGKSYLADKLAKENPTHLLVHTDSYAKYGYEQALYMLMEDLAKTKCNTIIEGYLGYRLLRKGVQRGTYYPDIVIELDVTEERMEQTYKEQRRDKDIALVKAANKGHQKVLKDYQALDNPHKPQWVTIKNHY